MCRTGGRSRRRRRASPRSRAGTRTAHVPHAVALPQPSSPHDEAPHDGVQLALQAPATQKGAAEGQEPQEPPQPSSPQERPEQSGAQKQRPVVEEHERGAAQEPQRPPQPSSPHSRAVHQSSTSSGLPSKRLTRWTKGVASSAPGCPSPATRNVTAVPPAGSELRETSA
eukprot:m51a1_g13518 hypothetical protein (169) ;mRNA; f:204-940